MEKKYNEVFFKIKIEENIDLSEIENRLDRQKDEITDMHQTHIYLFKRINNLRNWLLFFIVCDIVLIVLRAIKI